MHALISLVRSIGNMVYALDTFEEDVLGVEGGTAGGENISCPYVDC